MSEPRSSTSPACGEQLDQRGDRRLGPSTEQTPLDTLRALPTLLVLERLPVPVLAVRHDGTIIFANDHVATGIGYPREALASVPFVDIFHALPTDESAVSLVRETPGSSSNCSTPRAGPSSPE